MQAWGRKATRGMVTGAPARRVAAREPWGPGCDSPHAVSPVESGCHRRCDVWGRSGRVPTLRGNRGATAAATISGRAHALSVATSPLLLCHPLEPLCHHVSVPPHHRHRVTAARCRPSPRRLHSTEHHPSRPRARPVRGAPAAGRVPPPRPAVPHPSPGAPRESGAGGVGGGGFDLFYSHRGKNERVKAVCIFGERPAGLGAAALQPLREALLARLVSGLSAAPADGVNNSVFFFFFLFFFCFFVFWRIAGVGGKVLLGWIVGLFVFCLFFFFFFLFKTV